MLDNEFESSAPGSLIAIEGGIAFLPDPLPVETPVSKRILAAVGMRGGPWGNSSGRSACWTTRA